MAMESFGFKEAADYSIRHSAGKDGQILGWVKTNSVNALSLVRREQCPVVAANVQHRITTLEAHQLFGSVGNIGQRTPHSLIGSRTVPIIVVHHFARYGVLQLETLAARAQCQA